MVTGAGASVLAPSPASLPDPQSTPIGAVVTSAGPSALGPVPTSLRNPQIIPIGAMFTGAGVPGPAPSPASLLNTQSTATGSNNAQGMATPSPGRRTFGQVAPPGSAKRTTKVNMYRVQCVFAYLIDVNTYDSYLGHYPLNVKSSTQSWSTLSLQTATPIFPT